MKHVTCPHCNVSIPAERFRGGAIIIPEFLTCDVCGQVFEIENHTGNENEGAIHHIAEHLDNIPDASCQEEK